VKKSKNLSLSNFSNSKPKRFLVNYLAKQCRHVFYHAKESLGLHKRDLVVCRVEEACDSLQETKQQFEGALEKFKELALIQGGSLETRYRILKQQLVLSESKAKAVHERILLIEDVSEALFCEWETELENYSNRHLRTQSRQQLKSSRRHYGRLIKAMYRAEAKIKPVLSAFRDQVLFLKHNLNAQAIAALQYELMEISVDISQLILAMEHSIAEANSFVLVLVKQKTLSHAG